MLSILALHITFPLKHVMASVYTVGDQDEWSSSQTNYASWAGRYNFSRGDVLVFRYIKGQHNVYEVTEESFRSCDADSGVLAKYESGEDEVALSEVKKYWFICNFAGHCYGGMRFGIEVKDAALQMMQPPSIEPAPLDNSCTTYFVSQRWRVFHNSIPLGLFLFNYYFW
ncbi:Cupredoxin [Vigna unguiculata]|uniref:Cupredoxin n=1 Tax=Vigna unguiculata TaxID=3917 RepID=A0A4D6N9T0_VIGUN|nr:Cupredoxin [Vigna unguiculata]